MGVIYFLGHFAILSSLFPLFFSYRRKKIKLNLIIVFYVIEIALSNIINLLLFHFSNINQDLFFLSNLFIETFIILLVYYSFVSSKSLKKIIIYVLLFSTLMFIWTMTLGIGNRFTYYGTYSRITLTIMSILIIISQYLKSIDFSLFSDFRFNFSASVLIYCGLQLYVLVFNNIISEHLETLFIYTWPIIQISSILHYLTLSISIWKLKN